MSKKLPKQAILKTNKDKLWNYIPLGYAQNKKGKVDIIGWYLNDQNYSDFIETYPATSMLITGGTGSGKSVAERCILEHTASFPDKFQVVAVDCKRVEFLQDEVQKMCNAVITDQVATADAAVSLQRLMMSRFKLMENYQVNNVWKLEKREAVVPYYEIEGVGKLQFDELFQIEQDLDENDRNYQRLKMIYPTGKQPRVMTIQEIYEKLQEKTIKSVSIKGKVVTAKDIKEVTGVYHPKAVLFMIDEYEEAQSGEDYKAIDTIKSAIGSICRLGRASGIHICIGCQRANSKSISTDLWNNIGLRLLLGGFSEETSLFLFEKDISNKCKPEIKGRGFLGYGNTIVEIQIFEGKTNNFY